MEKDRLTFSISEVGRKLGISRNLAYDLARTGRLPVLRLGKRLLVSRAALEKLLQAAGQSGGQG